MSFWSRIFGPDCGKFLKMEKEKMASVDTNTELQKKFDSLAVKALSPLRRARDNGLRITPETMEEIKSSVSQKIAEVFYGIDS